MFFGFQKEKSTAANLPSPLKFEIRSSFETAGVFDPTDIRDPGWGDSVADALYPTNQISHKSDF
jgi:hypothetical protein